MFPWFAASDMSDVAGVPGAGVPLLLRRAATGSALITEGHFPDVCLRQGESVWEEDRRCFGFACVFSLGCKY
jgi:hypothetical protein